MDVRNEGQGLLAATPPMGWNSWNSFGSKVSEKVVKETADVIASSGLRDLGYRYVVIDDCWSMKERGPKGELVPDPERFPNGIKPLCDHVHSRGLMLGIYSDAAELTCANYPGSFGFEERDAELWASWGIDLLKYDYCHAPGDQGTAIERYRRMGGALQKTGRRFFYSLCEWGGRRPHLWGRSVGGHAWRITGDVMDSWTDFTVSETWVGVGIESAIEIAASLTGYSGPGGWNDLDMLVVGLKGRGPVHGDGATDNEYRTQFSMWSALCSPLMIGCDVRNLDEKTRKLLSNPEVIALNQDPLGRPAARIRQSGFLEIWKKPLADGSFALALLNKGSTVLDFKLHKGDFGLLDSFKGVARDLWEHRDVSEISPYLEGRVQPHDTRLFKITPM